MSTEQINQIPELAKTLRASEIADRFNTTRYAVYRYARLLERRDGITITFVRAKPGLKSKV